MKRESINKKIDAEVKNKPNIAAAILAACVVILLAFTIWMAFFRKDNIYDMDFSAGKSAQLSIEENKSVTHSLVLPGNFPQGYALSQIVSVSSLPTSSELYVRAKCEHSSGTSVELETFDNWIKKDDGYYYYDKILLPMQTISFIKSFQISSKTLSEEKITALSVVFESLSLDVPTPENYWGELKNIEFNY